MFQYPLTFTFPLFSVSPQFEAKDASGRTIFSASKKLISSKDEINILADGRPLFNVVSQENKITDIPSNWDVTTSDGKALGVVDDDYLSAIDTSKFMGNSVMSSMMDMQIERSLNLRAAKMYWINDTSGSHRGLIAPDKNSLIVEQLPLYRYIRQLPLFYRFITPRYYIRLGEETVMFMEKKRTLLQDVYTLEARGQFSEEDEKLLVSSAALAVLYERQQLKELYS